MSDGYGVCPGCGIQYQLTKGGVLRKHYVVPRWRRVECLGIGQQPKAVR